MHSRKHHTGMQNKPINHIMNLKSNQDLRQYLEGRPELNLSLMRQKNDSSLLHFAAFKNQLSKIKIYILHFEAFSKENHKRNKNQASFQSQLKAWINVQNTDGLTALHFAALHGNTQMIEFLQRYGANLQVQSKEKENILFMCAQNNHLKSAVYLLQHRQGKIPFNVNQGNHLGDTILHKTAKHGFSNFTAYLLNRQDVQIDARNHEGWTPLMYAVSAGHKQIVKRMLLKGVNRHLTNQEDQQSINLAIALGKTQIARMLNDEYTNCEKLKILCNLKIVYDVEKSNYYYSILFFVLFHLVFLPSNLLAEVEIFGQDKFYLFYVAIGLYYLLTMVLYILLMRKHPSKTAKNLLEIDLPICPQCRNTYRSTQFHCFTCGKCIFRYDHHCPWINNCVSSFNIGKFTFFLILLLLGCLEVTFISICLNFNFFSAIRESRLIQLPEDKYYLVNMIVSSFLAFVSFILVFSLLLDQLTNIFTNTTSYERAKNSNKKSSTLLSAHSEEGTMMDSINEEEKIAVTQDQSEEDEPSCFGNCCSMLSQKYNSE